MLKQKNRLIILISSLLIAGFLLTSLASYYISVTSLRDHVANSELPLTSDNIYSEIQRDLLRPIFISSLMATDTFLRDWIIRGEQDHSEIIRYLKEIKQKYNAFTTFFVSEQTHNYYHAKGVLKKVMPGEPRDTWYFRVRNLDDDYEINVDIDMANNDALTVFVNYRVYDYQGKFIGATGLGLNVDAVKKLIDRYQKTYHRDILFIDRNGDIKLSSTQPTGNKKYHLELERLIKSGDLLGLVTAQDAGSFDYRLTNQTVLLNSRYIEEFDWYLLVAQSEVAGEGEQFDALMVNLAACALITTIVLIIINLSISSYQQQIEQMATTDKLTGLYNRQALDIIFNQLTLDQKRHPGKLTVLLFDIDNFKGINDEHGHLAGDSVLVHIAHLTASRLRESDIICRWGGEEFLVLLKDCDLETGSNIAEELRLSVLNNPCSYQQGSINTTISVGVVGYRAKDSKDQMISRADKALYSAKRNGKNRVTIIN